jgi:hypothetical protein
VRIEDGICNLHKFYKPVGVTEKIRNFVHQKVLCRFQKIRISIATLKYPRWVKLGTLFYATVDKIKQAFLIQQGHKNKTQNKLLSFKSNEKQNRKSKYYWVTSCKVLSL